MVPLENSGVISVDWTDDALGNLRDEQAEQQIDLDPSCKSGGACVPRDISCPLISLRCRHAAANCSNFNLESFRGIMSQVWPSIKLSCPQARSSSSCRSELG